MSEPADVTIGQEIVHMYEGTTLPDGDVADAIDGAVADAIRRERQACWEAAARISPEAAAAIRRREDG